MAKNDAFESREKRNLFVVDNSRMMSREEVVETFVTTKEFWELLSPANQVILGARGSGKTALVKMLSHPYLKRLGGRAASIVERAELIGLYVPMSTTWVSSMKNKPWPDDAKRDAYFNWRLNMATCHAALDTLTSCLDSYVPERRQISAEQTLVSRLSAIWAPDRPSCKSIQEMRAYLQDLEMLRQMQLAAAHTTGRMPAETELRGLAFDTELFEPLKYSLLAAAAVMNLPEHTTWMLCLDEAEFLEVEHHRMLNTHMRSHSNNIVFKLTTTPNGHHTLETNVGDDLSEGHDFTYVHLHRDPIRNVRETQEFAEAVLAKRLAYSFPTNPSPKLEELLGVSELLDADQEHMDDSEFMRLLAQHATPDVLSRAVDLRDNYPARFRNEMVRKLRGVLMLREAVRNAEGNAQIDAYSGLTMVLRCTDSMPRRMIRVFNHILDFADLTAVGLIPRKQQSRIVMDFSRETLRRIASEPKVGPALYKVICKIGAYMKSELHAEPLSGTDTVCSVTANDRLSPEYQELIARAVDLALLMPNQKDMVPITFLTAPKMHLAYALAPTFRLLPRRGKHRSLRSVLEGADVDQLTLDGGSC